MPRYYFHVRDGVEIADDVGSDHATEAGARREAMRVMGALFQVAAYDPGLEDWRLEATDAQGRIAFVLRPAFTGPEMTLG